MRALVLCALSACGTMGLDTDKSDTASLDSGGLASVRIDAVTPNYGPLGGGAEVVVSGAGFDEGTAVWFGGAEVDVTRIDSATLLVLSPAVPVEATVDVRVVTPSGEAVLPGGFTFTDAVGGDGGGGDGGGSGDGSGDGGDGGGDNSGLLTGRVQMDYLVIGCPSCFGFPSNLAVDAGVWVHDPVAGTWLDDLPPNGGCYRDPTPSAPTSRFLDVGNTVYLESGASAAIALSRSSLDGQTVYLASGLAGDDYLRNAAWDLIVPGLSLTVPGALRTTGGFTDIQPLAMLNDGGQAFSPLSASNAVFAWAPAGVADTVVVDILVFDPASGAQVGEVLCAADDTGSLQVPPAGFDGFYAGDLVAIYLYRWETTRSTRPDDGSTIEGMTLFGGLGTGSLVP